MKICFGFSMIYVIVYILLLIILSNFPNKFSTNIYKYLAKLMLKKGSKILVLSLCVLANQCLWECYNMIKKCAIELMTINVLKEAVIFSAISF